MTEEKKQLILKILQDSLKLSEEEWYEKTKSNAWIIGYLQGTIKFVIKEME